MYFWVVALGFLTCEIVIFLSPAIHHKPIEIPHKRHYFISMLALTIVVSFSFGCILPEPLKKIEELTLFFFPLKILNDNSIFFISGILMRLLLCVCFLQGIISLIANQLKPPSNEE